MQTRLLDEADFKATLVLPTQNVTSLAGEAIDIWPYVDAIPAGDLQNLKLFDVTNVYRNAPATFEHVLIGTDQRELFLVIVVDLLQSQVHGHRLLDLLVEYGLPRS